MRPINGRSGELSAQRLRRYRNESFSEPGSGDAESFESIEIHGNDATAKAT